MTVLALAKRLHTLLFLRPFISDQELERVAPRGRRIQNLNNEFHGGYIS